MDGGDNLHGQGNYDSNMPNIGPHDGADTLEAVEEAQRPQASLAAAPAAETDQQTFEQRQR